MLRRESTAEIRSGPRAALKTIQHDHIQQKLRGYLTAKSALVPGEKSTTEPEAALLVLGEGRVNVIAALVYVLSESISKPKVK